MTKEIYDPAIIDFVLRVIRLGSAYDMEGMEALYTADQSLLFLDDEGRVVRSSRADMLAEFRGRRDDGEASLSTEHRFLHVEQQGDHATVLLYRRMSPATRPALYELRLRKEAGNWMVAGETVLPWPDLAHAGDFLPPRALARAPQAAGAGDPRP
ncbi:hypothetical protein DDF62_14630 [Caulobacter radicis]|uniref:hypothetical protein n=1 Tax=Caulobacter radicis TaxID=2172650 RepID=UPI000D567C96|nr:hypothetical protein [Caulobacter radicis]PVM88428.1 hypothetical protein DDF62_14630 [Caulobacter radicis]